MWADGLALPADAGCTIRGMEPRIQYAKTLDGFDIAYIDTGQGLPVITVPPIPWTSLELQLKDAGYRRWIDANSRHRRLILYDSRGSGLSDRNLRRLDIGDFMLDIDAVADRLGLEGFALFGTSVGGPVSIAYAATRPDRVSHLVLWCGPARTDDVATQRNDALRLLMTSDWPLFTETVAHAMVAGWGSSEEARRFAELMRVSVEPTSILLRIGIDWSFDATDDLPKVKCPTLVMQRRGVNVPSVESARYVAARIPHAELVVVGGGSLLPWVGDMDEVLGPLDSFLGVATDIDAGRASLETGPTAQPFRAVLFTDLVGHTEMMSRLGDQRGRAVLREHESIARHVLKEHGGTEVKTMGDGFMASFGSVTKAVECAVALQRAFADHEGEPLSVRVGLNAGEPIEEDGDLFGATVILASRIAAKAGAGEILVSDNVRSLCAGKAFLFADRGEFAAKGFEEPVRVYEVRWRE
jgi:class 3 adenylate cyclase/pimeloyl-ACP methyl ester carboxylesterase